MAIRLTEVVRKALIASAFTPSCANSVNSGSCDREGCHFQHLQGTRRVRAPQNQQLSPAPTYSRVARQGSHNQSAQQNRLSHASSGHDPTQLVMRKQADNNSSPMNSDLQNFHVIQQQIQQMQSQILTILQRETPAPAITRVGGCTHCLQKCL